MIAVYLNKMSKFAQDCIAKFPNQEPWATEHLVLTFVEIDTSATVAK